VRANVRKLLIGLPVAGVLVAILVPFAYFFAGLAFGPPQPQPATTPVPPLIAAAIWARADGGSATALEPVTPISMARFAGCMAIEDFWDETPGDARRVEACRKYMPALTGVEYLSKVHMRDSGLQTSFREGLARFSTLILITHSWSKEELLRTAAERGEFGAGLRGIEAASRHYFGRPAAELSLAQAAMLAAFIGDRTTAFDPWCEAAAAAEMRGRVLRRLRDDRSIDEAALNAANLSELDLGPPPADHKPCRD
jgi:hypothetical protein